jgi:Domain of unknown function (DUF6457)
MGQSAREWLASYAAELGTPPPSDEEVEQLLALAGIAAHASERTAAPITCWLAGRAGLAPGDALAAGRRLAGSEPDRRP